jgi:hypothetical protein
MGLGDGIDFKRTNTLKLRQIRRQRLSFRILCIEILPMQELGRIASRIIVGTGIYVVIVVLAARLPAAAGLMLTFPALNGLAFLFSPDDKAAAIAKTMFWMPVVNGALCAGYILVFLLLARTLPPVSVGWGLLAVVAASWFVWVSRPAVRRGIDPSSQLKFGLVATLLGVALAAATLLALTHLAIAPRDTALASDAGHWSWIADAIVRSKLKIALFALTLAIFILAVQYWPVSDSTRGILAGLPIVPFGGLVAVGGDAGMTADLQLQTFLGMIGGAFLGPAVAIWFIYGLSRVLGARTKASVPATDSVLRFGALVVGWLVTFAMILAIAWAMNALSAHAYGPQG